MIKLYILYFMFGLYMLFESFSIWVFSDLTEAALLLLIWAMISSAVLFSQLQCFFPASQLS